MKRMLTMAVMALGILAAPALAETRTVQATGEGVDVSAARRDAQRSAIEQAVGVFVDAKTLVENFQTVEDKIRTHAQAFIKSFKELGEPQRTSDGTWIVRIEATVTDETANTIKDDLSAMQITLQNAEYPKIMVYYDAEAYKDMAEFQDPKHVYLTKWAVDNINSVFGKKGFDYVLPEEIERLRQSDREILQAKGGNESVIREIANRLKAEYYVKFKIHKENGQKVVISINMFEAASGIGKGSETGYSLPLRQEPSITKAIQKSVQDALDKPNGVVAQLLNSLKVQAARGKEFILVFDNIKNDDMLDEIFDALEGMSKKVKLAHSSGDHAEFSVYSDEDASGFQRSVRKALKNVVKLDGKNVVRGNRINLYITK